MHFYELDVKTEDELKKDLELIMGELEAQENLKRFKDMWNIPRKIKKEI